MQDLAVVIPHYNRFEFLARCVASLLADGLEPEAIVVVDNASADASVELLGREFPAVRCIANAENRGFARAANQGIFDTRSRYVLLLNNDTEVLPGTLKALVEFAEAHLDAGAVGCRLLQSDGTPHRLPASIFSPLAWDQEHPRRVPWLVGAALLLRREAIEAIGGLDETFFFYYEDLDLGLRLRRAGWRNYFTPDGRIVHHEKASTSLVRPMALANLYRGRLLLVRRYHPWAYGLTRLWLRLTLALSIARARRRGAEGRALVQAAGDIRAILAE